MGKGRGKGSAARFQKERGICNAAQKEEKKSARIRVFIRGGGGGGREREGDLFLKRGDPGGLPLMCSKGDRIQFGSPKARARGWPTEEMVSPSSRS